MLSYSQHHHAHRLTKHLTYFWICLGCLNVFVRMHACIFRKSPGVLSLEIHTLVLCFLQQHTAQEARAKFHPPTARPSVSTSTSLVPLFRPGDSTAAAFVRMELMSGRLLDKHSFVAPLKAKLSWLRDITNRDESHATVAFGL